MMIVSMIKTMAKVYLNFLKYCCQNLFLIRFSSLFRSSLLLLASLSSCSKTTTYVSIKKFKTMSVHLGIIRRCGFEHNESHSNDFW